MYFLQSLNTSKKEGGCFIMAKRKATSRNFSFESNFPIGTNKKFTKICDDMMESEAWKDLTMREKGLYLMLKKRFVSKNGGTNTNENELYIYHKDFQRDYGSKNTLFDDVDGLIDHGFIKVIENGKNARLPNIYGFSDKWKKYGTSDFFIHPREKRWTAKNSYAVNTE
jgi:hypothetical protein